MEVRMLDSHFDKENIGKTRIIWENARFVY